VDARKRRHRITLDGGSVAQLARQRAAYALASTDTYLRIMAGSVSGSHSPCTGVDMAGFRKENTLNNETPSKALEWLNLLLGSGLALAAFAFAGPTVAAWNAGIVGTLIACCAAVALYRYGAWAEWSNIALGCWAAISPFALGFTAASGPTWSLILVGSSVAWIAAMQIAAGRNGRTRTTT